MRDGVFTGSEAQEGLSIIIKESERLRHLVDEIIYLTRLETMPEQAKSRVPLNQLLEEVLEVLAPVIREKGLKMNLPEQPDLALWGDGEKLRRLFLNLLGNAVRYARTAVTLRLERTEKTLGIFIEDDGPGFPPNLLPLLGERFVKGEGGHTGLGLAIARAIIEGHGGELKLGNRAEGGTQVYFRLPLSP